MHLFAWEFNWALISHFGSAADWRLCQQSFRRTRCIQKVLIQRPRPAHPLHILSRSLKCVDDCLWDLLRWYWPWLRARRLLEVSWRCSNDHLRIESESENQIRNHWQSGVQWNSVSFVPAISMESRLLWGSNCHKRREWSHTNDWVTVTSLHTSLDPFLRELYRSGNLVVSVPCYLEQSKTQWNILHDVD